jgi:type IV secretory pathway VirB10-like protein
MVSPMFTVFQTMTGFHGGLRRGAVAGAVGAMLVLSAGVPAANAAGPTAQDRCFLLFCSPSPPETAEPTPTDSPPSPADPSEGQAPPGPPAAPPAPAPSSPSVPGPTAGTAAPVEGATTGPSAPADATADGAHPASAPSSAGSDARTNGSGANNQQVQAAGGLGSAGQGIAPASGAQDAGARDKTSRHLEQASLVNQDKGIGTSVWWGIGLLAVAGFALVAFLKLRRASSNSVPLRKSLSKSP